MEDDAPSPVMVTAGRAYQASHAGTGHMALAFLNPSGETLALHDMPCTAVAPAGATHARFVRMAPGTFVDERLIQRTKMPDRLSLDPRSPFHDKRLLDRGVGVRFKGVEIKNCAEYCISERWVRRIPAGRTYREAVKLQGDVEAWMRDEGESS